MSNISVNPAFEQSTQTNTTLNKPVIKVRAKVPNVEPPKIEIKSKVNPLPGFGQTLPHKPLPVSTKRFDNIKNQIKPIFMLRGVEILKVLEKYKSGHFDDLHINPNQISLVTKISELVLIGDSASDPIYTFDKNGSAPTRIATTNIVHLDHLTDKYATLDCKHCKQKITGPVMGIPIHYRRVENLYIFTLAEHYCGFCCAYTGLKQRIDKEYSHISPDYHNSEALLHFLFNMIYPGQELKETPDWVLLTSNNGSLSAAEFYDSGDRTREMGHSTYPYVPNDNIRLELNKNQFVMLT